MSEPNALCNIGRFWDVVNGLLVYDAGTRGNVVNCGYVTELVVCYRTYTREMEWIAIGIVFGSAGLTSH